MTVTRNVTKPVLSDVIGSVSGGGTIVSQTMDFGALDLQTHGAVPDHTGTITAASITGGTVSADFDIDAAGKLTVSATGAGSISAGTVLADITIDGVVYSITITINALPDTYVVGDGELQDVIDEGGVAVSGKTIAGRAGADIGGTSAGDEVDIPTTFAPAAEVIVESLNSASLANIRRLGLRHDGLITFRDINIRDQFIPATDLYDNASIVRFKNNATGRSRAKFEGVEFFTQGGDTVAFDGSTLVSGTAAAHTGGVSSATITLTDSPDLSGLSGGGEYGVRLGTSIYRIDAVDDGADTITIHAAVTIASGSPVNYTIGRTPKFLKGISQDGGITNNPDLELTDSKLEHLSRTLSGEYRVHDVQRNWFEHNYNDNVSVAVDGTETGFDYLDNFIGGSQAKTTDALDPHSDGIQVNINPMTQQNTITYNIHGTRHWPRNAKRETQPIFIENVNGSAFGVNVSIKHNMLLSNAANVINVEDMAAGSEIRSNIAAFDTDDPGNVDLTPAIRLDVENGVGTISENAVHAFVFNSSSLNDAAKTNNHVFATKDDAGLAAVLVGTAFGASDFSSLADFTTKMQGGAGEALLTADPQIGAGPYYTYDNTAAPAVSKSGLGTGLANEPASYAHTAADNNNSGYGSSTTYSGGAASKSGVMSFWMYVAPSTWPASGTLFEFRDGSGNPRLEVKLASSGRLNFIGDNAAGTPILQRVLNTSTLAVQTWYHIAVAYDLANTTAHVYINGVEETSFAISTTTDDTIPELAQVGLFATRTGSALCDVWLFDPYFDHTTFRDISDSGVLANFIDGDGKPVDLSAYGSPQILLDNPHGTFYTNSGSGGNFTANAGPLIEAASSPSD